MYEWWSCRQTCFISCYDNVVVTVRLCLWCVVERLTWRLNHSRSLACVPASFHTHTTTSLHETPTSVPWASRPWVRITHRHAISTVIMTSQRSLSNDLSHTHIALFMYSTLPHQDMLKPGKLQVFCSRSGSCQGLQNLVRARDLCWHVSRPVWEFTRFMWWMQPECQAATNPQTKPTDLGCGESTCRLPSSTPTVAIYYYYTAERLILPSHRG